MMEKSLSKYEVLSEAKIRQKIAGYKSAWTKRIRAAKPSERKKIYAKSVVELARVEKDIREFNKKQIQRLAGAKSWVTRRINEEAKKTSSKYHNDLKKAVINVSNKMTKNTKKHTASCNSVGHKITMCVKKNKNN